MQALFPQDIQEKIVPILRAGGIGVLPTDTIYGLVGSALNQKTVERIYRLRKRSSHKPMIVLISDTHDLKLFSITLSSPMKKALTSLWPACVSVVLENSLAKFAYLHRGKKTIAFRIPDESSLRALLKKTGPLVAPSANFEGEKPAKNATEAEKFFADKIDFYVDAGVLKSQPSTIVAMDKMGKFEIIRKGAVRI